jgi:hypothetical protein
MTNTQADTVLFVTLVRHPAQRPGARLLVESIRAFGGPLSGCPIWIFETGEAGPAILDAESRPLEIPEAITTTPFAAKVFACARAEALAGPEVESLIWIGPDCLVLNPPILMGLGPGHDAAVRPVHIQNVGLAATDTIDPFWAAVYRALGVDDVGLTVESFVDRKQLRAYFNSHILSVNPSVGLCREWFDLFAALATDEVFQAGAGRDQLHQIFLHQAVLSTLLATRVDPDRLRILPPDYSYPYNLQDRVPADRRATALNDLVCIACEDRPLHPSHVHDIAIRPPLRAWLAARITPNG